MNTLTDNTTTATDVQVGSLDEALKVVAFQRIVRAKERIAEAERTITNETERLYELLGGAKGKHVLPGGVGEITFSDNNVYSDADMLSALRPGQQRLVTKRVLDRAKVKAMYPAVYEAARSYRGYKSSVKAYK